MTIAAPSPHLCLTPSFTTAMATTTPYTTYLRHGRRAISAAFLNRMPYWELRQSRIFLDDCFRGGGMQRLFTPVVPGPDRLERERLREQATSGDTEQRTRSTVRFRSALDFAQEQANCSRSPRLIITAGLTNVTSPPPSQEQEDYEYEDWDGLSDTASTSRDASIPIPNPPIPGPAAVSVDALQFHVNEFAKENEFGVIRRNGSGNQARKTRYVFQCDRYGEPRMPRGADLRQRRSRKCGCKWKVIAEALERNDYMWTLRAFADLQHSQHNHDRSMSLSAHPVHRRLTDSVKATVEATSRRVGIRARDVRGIVQEKHRGTHYTRRDIYNARALLQGIPYIVKWSATEPDRLVGLLWTFPYCLRMWKRFPGTLSFDNTYNTNRFKLPLFQVTGQTCLKSVYNAAFGLIDNERREGFQFLAEAVRELNDRHMIPLPNVVVTDYDQQMKAALESQYPESQQQYVFNISTQIRNEDPESDGDGNPNARLSSGDMEAVLALERQESSLNQSNVTAPVPHNYRGVLELWKFVAFAETKEEHEKAWVRLCGEFNDQQAILMYLYKTYLPIRAQWAQCFIKKYRNFGVRVTSGTEASNNNVKSYLLNGMSHLYSLVEAIEAMLGDQERDFIDNCSQDEVLTSRTYSGPGSEYLGELRTVMSEPGLKLIAKEHRQALRSIPSRSRPWPEPIGDCNEDCSVSWQLGIPCCHTIYNKLEAGIPLTKWDVHPRWHLREPTSHNPYRRILDPKIAACLRGRPKNATQPVPESMKIRPSSRSRAAVGKAGPGRKPARKSAILGPGKQTGVRQAGRRRQPSVRRRRSEWRPSLMKRGRKLSRSGDGKVPVRGLSLQRLQSYQILVARKAAAIRKYRVFWTVKIACP
ncbi:MULE transposase [Hirsutella rhossiliensis]